MSAALANSKEMEAQTGPGTADRSHGWRERRRGSCVPSLPPQPSSPHFMAPPFLSLSPPSALLEVPSQPRAPGGRLSPLLLRRNAGRKVSCVFTRLQVTVALPSGGFAFSHFTGNIGRRKTAPVSTWGSPAWGAG